MSAHEIMKLLQDAILVLGNVNVNLVLLLLHKHGCVIVIAFGSSLSEIFLTAGVSSASIHTLTFDSFSCNRISFCRVAYAER